MAVLEGVAASYERGTPVTLALCRVSTSSILSAFKDRVPDFRQELFRTSLKQVASPISLKQVASLSQTGCESHVETFVATKGGNETFVATKGGNLSQAGRVRTGSWTGLSSTVCGVRA